MSLIFTFLIRSITKVVLSFVVHTVLIFTLSRESEITFLKNYHLLGLGNIYLLKAKVLHSKFCDASFFENFMAITLHL